MTFISNYTPINKNDRESVKAVKQYTICRTVMDWNLVFDRFGYFDKELPKGYNTFFFDVPKEDNTNLLDACFERAEQLGSVRLAWSGGVDSTLILAVYKALGIEIAPVYFVDGGEFSIPKPLLKYVENNFPLTYENTQNIKGNVMTAGACDCLFNSVARPPDSSEHYRYGKRHIVKFLPIKYIYSDTWGNLDGYADFVGVKLKSNLDVLRLMNLGCKYFTAARENGMLHKLGENQFSFYDSQRFTDIAFTQYWHRQCLENPKKEFEKSFIRKVFGSDFGVTKNV